ncbi:endonuclease domain-containing protein [Leifsonia sp. NPDC058292]|uniref:endonuclease domain-containing protein n=1 Tax=Leifsonia sp. NPDC058292 TaxID=3346428 RepID=UPI0036D9574B
MDPGHFFSHTTAAMLWGLPLSPRFEDAAELHVSVASPRRAPKGAGIVGHKLRIDQARLGMRRGLPVPDPVEVWCELGSMLGLDELVQVGDALLRRSNPLATADELRLAVEHAATRPGVRRLQEAFAHVRARTDSPMETVLRLAIVRARLPEPQTNYRIVDREGRFVAFGDLVFPGERVVVEYDGDHHRHDPEQYATDIDRLWRIQNLGWTVVRINKTHLDGAAREAVGRIRAALTH